jgi:hypothetical protein
VFREFQLYRLLAFGLLLMVLMIFRPSGLFPAGGSRAAEPETPDLGGGAPEPSTGKKRA